MRDVPLLLVKSLKKLSSRACALFARIFAFSFIFLFLYRGCGGKFLFLSFLFLFCGVSAYNNPVQKGFLYAKTELLYTETILLYTETPFRYAKSLKLSFCIQKPSRPYWPFKPRSWHLQVSRTRGRALCGWRRRFSPNSS